MVVEGATLSNTYYNTFIDHYDLKKGVSDPPSGLDDTMRDAIAELVAYATAGFAAIVTQAVEEAAVAPPKVSLTLQGYIETLDIPLRWITSKMADAGDRAQVERMYKEFQKTGKVIRTLPEDDKIIRKKHAAQVLRVPLKKLDKQEIGPIGSAHVPPEGEAPPIEAAEMLLDEVVAEAPVMAEEAVIEDVAVEEVAEAEIDVEEEIEDAADEEVEDEAQQDVEDEADDELILDADELAELEEADFSEDEADLSASDDEDEEVEDEDEFEEDESEDEYESEDDEDEYEDEESDDEEDEESEEYDEEEDDEESEYEDENEAEEYDDSAEEESEDAVDADEASDEAPEPVYAHSQGLTREDPVVDAPSIGPKTAARLEAIDIYTIGDLLDCDIEETAFLLDVHYIDSETIRDWQDQTRLMMEIPGLRVYDVQIMVGAGIRTKKELAEAPARTLFLLATEFLGTSEGQRVRRGDDLFMEEEVEEWIERAQDAA
jgi:hypothetical protein